MPRSLSENVARLERNRGTRKRRVVPWFRFIDVVDLLEQFDIANISQTGAQVYFSCPFPDHTHGDETPSATMNDGSINPDLTALWICYGCGRSGNAIGFVSEYLNVSRQQARVWLREHYAKGYKAPRYGSIAKEFEARYKLRQQRKEPEKLLTLEPEVLRRFGVDWGYYAEEHGDQPDVAYMLDRGFTPATLDDWGIGYDDRSKRITIPVCDADGNLVGFKGRAWQSDVRPKYRVLGDKSSRRRRYGFPTYDKSRVVFGLDRVRDQSPLVLVEGEIDVMSLDVLGIPAICTGGSSMSGAQARLIRQYTDELIVFFDSDTAGYNGLWGYDKPDGEHKPGVVETLEPFIRVRVVRRHRYDPNTYLVRGERDRVRDLISSAKRHLV